MDQFIFVLGSNWKLSLAELEVFLKSKPYKGDIIDYSSNIAVVEFDTLLEEKYYVDKLEKLQYYLGGTQKIGRVFEFINLHLLKQAFPTHVHNFNEVKQKRARINRDLENALDQIFPSIDKEKIFFAVSIYPELFDKDYYKDVLVKHLLPFLNTTISEKLKEKGAQKAIYFRYPQENIDSGNLNPIFPHHVIRYELLKEHRAEIIFGITEEGCYIARTFTADNPNFKRKIDEERPFKDYKDSIPPKLAIMMLNFLKIVENRHQQKVLDLFVGNGDIALFALVEDFLFYGTDEDPTSIQRTIKNVKWLQEELKIEPIRNLNERFKQVALQNLSKKFEANFFDGIVTKPNLGPSYTEKPYYSQARELVESKLEPMYETIFEQASKLLKPEGRICIIAPSISIMDDKKDLRLDIENIAIQNEFAKVPLITSKRIANKSNEQLQFRKHKLYSIMDAKKEQIIKRKLYVFEKKPNG
jgi:tRNA G10  N-methylase Trm11